MRQILLPLLLAAASASPSAEPAPHLTFDIVVYGGTSAGVIAAYTAKRSGKRVLLIEPGHHLGGMSSGGLGYTDIGNKYAVTGLGLDFYRRLGRYYGQLEAWQFEPHAAEQVFNQYVSEADLDVLYSRRLRGVDKHGPWIRSITLERATQGAPPENVVVVAQAFIDASYEGDLMAKAGASYVVGREANTRYRETINGVQLRGTHQFPEGVDPYVVPGDSLSGLLAGISGVGVNAAGSGDTKVQTYNFRMCLCQGESRLPISRPEGYDLRRYELLIRLMAKRPWNGLASGFSIDRMPNGKSDWNNNGAFSTDNVGQSWAYPDADFALRARIKADHEAYQKGLVYFVGNDPRVPEPIRREMRSWGYCPDEFLDTGGWPHQLYIREARRLVGEYVMTEHNVRGRESVADGVALAAYGMDSHNTQRVVLAGMVKNEGDVQVGGFSPYPISYRAITPRRNEVANLLVPVALSASHIAYGSIRMEPVFMVLGQAAGVAAVLAVDTHAAVQRIDVREVQRRLRDNPLADGSTPEVIVDDSDIDRVHVTGAWERTATRGSYGPSLLKSGGGAGVVRFRPHLAVAGRYAVYIYWPRIGGLTSNASVEIRHRGGAASVHVDMRSSTETAQGGLASWRPLGEFEFTEGDDGGVDINAPGADGVVVADAVLFLPLRPRP
ncbi:MAG: FAD-dependent oxidoreductase [Gemmatimonadaceae bacterium]